MRGTRPIFEPAVKTKSICDENVYVQNIRSMKGARALFGLDYGRGRAFGFGKLPSSYIFHLSYFKLQYSTTKFHLPRCVPDAYKLVTYRLNHDGI